MELYDESAGKVNGRHVAIGEVDADLWMDAIKVVAELRGQRVVMIPLSVSVPSKDARSPQSIEPSEDAPTPFSFVHEATALPLAPRLVDGAKL